MTAPASTYPVRQEARRATSPLAPYAGRWSSAAGPAGADRLGKAATDVDLVIDYLWGKRTAAAMLAVVTRDILAELPSLAEQITDWAFDVETQPRPLAEVEQAWADSAGTKHRIVLVPKP